MVEREENLVDFVLLSYCPTASKRFAAMMEKESAIEGVQGAMSIEELSKRHNNYNRRGKPQKEKRNNNLERKTKRIKNTRELCLLSKSEESLRRCIVLLCFHAGIPWTSTIIAGTREQRRRGRRRRRRR